MMRSLRVLGNGNEVIFQLLKAAVGFGRGCLPFEPLNGALQEISISR